MKSDYKKVYKILKRKLKNKILENVFLKTLTSFKIGGIAKYVITVENLEDVFYSLKVLEKYKAKYFVLGNGTNVLASDNGFDGFIIKLSNKFADVEVKNNVVCAYAGASINKVCAVCKLKGLSGMENLFGIPGTIGGACYMNAGAYGTQIGDLVKCAYVYFNNKVNYLTKDELNFGYRYSKLKEMKNAIVLMVELELKYGNSKEIEQNMNEIMNLRRLKQPLEFPSAGSVFKKLDNIIVSKLLDKDRLKGYNINDACVSEKHAGFIVNLGNATATDVANLINYIKKRIYENYSIKLQEEIVYLGDFNDYIR